MSNIHNKENWLALYDLAREFQQLAPWNWMGDAQVFGVEHPTKKTLHFCVVFGRGGVVYGLNVYKGVEGLDSYIGILESSPYDNPLFTQRAIALAFEDRANLTKEDYAHIKQLGLSFRGKNNWIQFLDYTPGKHPWVMAAEDVDTMMIVLEQSMEVAKQVQTNPKLVTDGYVFIEHTNDLLIRKKVGGKWVSTFEDPDELMHEWEQQEENNRPELNPGTIEVLQDFKKKYPIEKYALINGLEYISAPIQEKKTDRPYYPFMALWLHHGSGQIVNQNMGSTEETEKLLYESLLGFVDSVKKLPAQIVVSSDLAYDYLHHLEELWGIEVIFNEDEMSARQVIHELMGYLGR
ncbi:MAG: hypothetical protein AAGI23_03140 [Bacteroidota bacterium]